MWSIMRSFKNGELMASDSTKLKRLILMASLLKTEDGLGIDLLAEKLAAAGYTCSRRTLSRDIDCLKNEFNASIRYSRSTYSYILDEEPNWQIDISTTKQESITYNQSSPSTENSELHSPSAPYYTSEVLIHNVTVQCEKEIWQSVQIDPAFCYSSVETINDKTLHVHFKTIAEKQLFYWLLCSEGKVQVIKPSKLRQDIYEALRAVAESHK